MFDINFTKNKFEKSKEPQDNPNFKNKGKKGLRCNRTACSTRAAYWWNRITCAFYCQPCAFRINESSTQSGMEPLCSCSEEDREEWNQARKIRMEVS
jgi:hypothetical protein